MQNYLCWDPNQVYAVINPEAESVPNSVFAAVHSDHPLMVAAPEGDRFQSLSAKAFRPISPTDFVADFLRADLHHVQVAVFGRSGSGKSHLIHWMKTRIESTDRRLVLTIPKSGTSLRSIVSMIIDRLDPADGSPFRDALHRVGDSILTRDAQKHELLNQIAQSIREARSKLKRDDGELEAALLDTLPDLFQDAYMRSQYFLKDDSVIGDLVDHVFSLKTEYSPRDERQQFRESDFPIGGHDWSKASEPAQNAILALQVDPDRTLPIAVDVVNRALDDSAIARAFGFSGDRVIQLMENLRRFLRKSGRELVLLIEDFAQLQGIDRALLQALITQGNHELCDIRWAIAATTGFFESVADTVYTRMSLFVDMDRSSGGAKGGIDASGLSEFAAKYLNAVRLGVAPLMDWYARNLEDDTRVPNACDRCAYREECHPVFGASKDGIGLYPFTKSALWNMASRGDAELVAAFSPRLLQKRVLINVLDTHAQALKLGKFPPAALLTDLGGQSALGIMATEKLRHNVPATEYEREVAYQELYVGRTDLRSIPNGIAIAFSLPKIDAKSAPPDDDEPGDYAGPVTLPLAQDLDLRELDEWAAGKALNQRLATTLREALYELIVSSIDWDAERLEQSYFCSPSKAKAFRNRSVIFERQDTESIRSGVMLRISPDGAIGNRVAVALRALLLARKHGNWVFPDSAQLFNALQECVTIWTTDVLSQIRGLVLGTAEWDPFIGAVELLGVGACVAGAITVDADGPAMVSAIFGSLPAESEAQSPQYRNLFKAVSKDRERLVSFVRAVASGTKGGDVGAFIDPKLIVKSLLALRRREWKLSQEPPTEAKLSDLEGIAKQYKSVSAVLDVASIAERNSRLEWLRRTREAFGPSSRRADVIKAAQALRDAAVSAGMGAYRMGVFKSNIEEFASIQYDETVRVVSSLDSEVSAMALLPLYGRTRSNAVSVTELFIKSFDEFAAFVSSELLNQSSQMGHEERLLTDSLLKIDAGLTSLAASLEVTL